MDHSVEPHPDNTLKRTRTARACQRCRSLKARCVSDEGADACKRCISTKKPCVWPEPVQPQLKRVRVSGTSRIVQMEQKLDGLVALLAEPADMARRPPTIPAPAPTATSSNPTPPSGRWTSPSATMPSPIKTAARSPAAPNSPPPPGRSTEAIDPGLSHRSRHGSLPGRTAAPAAAPVYEPAINLDVVRDLLASFEADRLLAEYRSMSAFFPFVPVSSGMTAQYLSQQKPMLLLAILTTASWRDRALQLSLEEQYRLELASRTIIRPRKTLGMIQSILVYLAWYHFYFTPQTQQITPLLQLTIGLITDLGIYQKSKRPLIDISGRPQPSNLSPGEEREIQRTLLGCYYLSSAFSTALSKPNLFKASAYMSECAQRLKDDLEYPSDGILLNLINLRRIDDQIYDTFQAEETPVISDMHRQMHLKLLESKMADWKTESRSDAYGQVCDLSYHFADMALHNLGTRMYSDATTTNAHASHVDILMSCFDAGKRFLDDILATPASQYHLYSFVEWMRLPYVLIIVSKLCFPSETHVPGWDVRAAQDRVRLDLCLESLCYRMQNLTTFNPAAQKQPDFWLAMTMIMEKTKAWYLRKTKQSTGTPASNEESPLENIQNPHSGPDSLEDADGVPETPDQAAVGMRGLQPAPPVEGGVDGGETNYDPFALPDFDQLEEFLDGGIWGGGGFDVAMFQNDDMGF